MLITGVMYIILSRTLLTKIVGCRRKMSGWKGMCEQDQSHAYITIMRGRTYTQRCNTHYQHI